MSQTPNAKQDLPPPPPAKVASATQQGPSAPPIPKPEIAAKKEQPPKRNKKKADPKKLRARDIKALKQQRDTEGLSPLEFFEAKLEIEKAFLQALKAQRGLEHLLTKAQQSEVQQLENKIYQLSQCTLGKIQPTKDPRDYNELTEHQKHVMLEAGTDLASELGRKNEYTDLTNHYNNAGCYCCAQCDLELYRGEDQFSHCGWPSFTKEIPGRTVRRMEEKSEELEISCAGCGGHLGHRYMHKEATTRIILPTGDTIDFDSSQIEIPKTGHRDCINSSCLVFQLKTSEELAEITKTAEEAPDRTALNTSSGTKLTDTKGLTVLGRGAKLDTSRTKQDDHLATAAQTKSAP